MRCSQLPKRLSAFTSSPDDWTGCTLKAARLRLNAPCCQVSRKVKLGFRKAEAGAALVLLQYRADSQRPAQGSETEVIRVNFGMYTLEGALDGSARSGFVAVSCRSASLSNRSATRQSRSHCQYLSQVARTALAKIGRSGGVLMITVSKRARTLNVPGYLLTQRVKLAVTCLHTVRRHQSRVEGPGRTRPCDARTPCE